MLVYFKNTQRAQISNKAAYYQHIAQIRDLESQHGDPDHPQNLINCRPTLKKSSNPLIICLVMAEFPIRQSTWCSRLPP